MISWIIIVGIIGCFVSLPIDFLAQPGQNNVTMSDPNSRPPDERIPLLSFGALFLGGLLFGALKIFQKVHRSLPSQQRRHVLQQIASLDDHYALGNIEEATYRHRRHQLKQQALDVTLQGTMRS